MPPSRNDLWTAFGLYGAAGIQFAGAVAAGMWVGWLCDKRWGTAPWLGAAGLILGAVVGFWTLYRILQWRGRK